MNPGDIRELAAELADRFRADLIEELGQRLADEDPQCSFIVGRIATPERRCVRLAGHTGDHLAVF